MSLVLRATKSALGAGRKASFLASGGTEPYIYTLESGGLGSINPTTGLYTAPAVLDADPKKAIQTIRATDDDGNFVTLDILVTDTLGLFCDILQKELGLADGRVYFWDQKINQPKDSGLYVAVSIMRSKPFGNTNAQTSGSGLDSVQSVNVVDTLGIDIISRGPEARTRKEEILIALASNYSIKQQEANSFSIGKIPAGSQFVNLSNIDGAAIPYRFNISINIQYFVTKTNPVDYFDEFEEVEVTTQD